MNTLEQAVIAAAVRMRECERQYERKRKTSRALGLRYYKAITDLKAAADMLIEAREVQAKIAAKFNSAEPQRITFMPSTGTPVMD